MFSSLVPFFLSCYFILYLREYLRQICLRTASFCPEIRCEYLTRRSLKTTCLSASVRNFSNSMPGLLKSVISGTIIDAQVLEIPPGRVIRLTHRVIENVFILLMSFPIDIFAGFSSGLPIRFSSKYSVCCFLGFY